MSEGLDTQPVTLPPVAPNRYVAFALIASVGLAADLVTKAVVFSWPGKLTGQVYWLWEGYAGFQTSLNEGALFGLGFGHVPVFAAISVLAAIAIPVWLFVFRAANDWWLTASLGAVMAGVLGNLYDRLGLSGEVWPAFDPRAGETVYAVRDWILWQLNDEWRWPNFNLADAFLVVGAGVLFLRAMFEPTHARGGGSEPTAGRPAAE
ncbi:signal peptidase II [Botrimarina mediterranea]|uniref:Lipoprotein signal peptidase n=1 Tax=Botrimarina mediterranea TaxID=2528022 RepID=A0A518K9D4_9BACT|nr:signal peptidase II [Botrimarina mediterranea]QDV74408.1 lipoprotein signal peptidase [Botrimarina mediterranea]QDV79004.1 lipoprotein signal peptidase [Planctomycetes bacterium K2D]